MKPEKELHTISEYAGMRFDLIQAGGGNSSVKASNNEMLIKSSGVLLSQVNESEGFVKVDYHKIRNFFDTTDFRKRSKNEREKLANEISNASMLSAKGKPSIETFLHAVMGRCTLHTHAITVNILACQDNWRDTLLSLFEDAICVPYATPGVDLAIELLHSLKEYKKRKQEMPEIVFLQNHGLIVSSDNISRVIELTEQVTKTIESCLQINFDRYRKVSAIHHLVSECGHEQTKVYLSEDSVVNQYFNRIDSEEKVLAFCPDTLVYCGLRAVFLDTEETKAESNRIHIENYCNMFNSHPNIVIHDQSVFIIAKTLKKAREAEELLKFHLIVEANTKSKVNKLTLDEISYLSAWDAEKYRQEL